MKKCKFSYFNTFSIRIDKFLSYIYKISRNNILYLINNKKILVNNKYIKKNYFLIKKDLIIILKSNFKYKYKLFPQKKKLNILYEDDYLLIINKKSNLIVNPTLYNHKNTLINYLLYKYNNNIFFLKKYNMGLINRLDKDTTGIILIAKNLKVLLHIQNQFKKHKVIKKYITLVNGIFKKKKICIKNRICRSRKNKFKMTISNIRGKFSITFFKRIKIFRKFTLLKCYLKTGRTHQIRVHLNSINFSVINDKIYKNPNNDNRFNKNFILNRQALHSYYIKFFHPIYKKNIIIYCKIPKDIKRFIKYYKYL
ncbi:MAG: RluA family pseudouridine synthase [Candidatus Shikimatogenerans sp. Tmey]